MDSRAYRWPSCITVTVAGFGDGCGAGGDWTMGPGPHSMTVPVMTADFAAAALDARLAAATTLPTMPRQLKSTATGFLNVRHPLSTT